MLSFTSSRRWQGKLQPTATDKPSLSPILRHSGLLTTCATSLLFVISHGAFLYFTVHLLGNNLGFSASRIGWIISGFGVGHVVCTLVLGPIPDRVEMRKPFVFSAIFGPGIMILLFDLLSTVLLMVIATLVIGFVTAPCCGIVPALASEASTRVRLRDGWRNTAPMSYRKRKEPPPSRSFWTNSRISSS